MKIKNIEEKCLQLSETNDKETEKSVIYVDDDGYPFSYDEDGYRRRRLFN